MLKKPKMRRLKIGVFSFIILYLMIASSLYFFQEKIIFRPTILSQNYTYNFSTNFEELFLKSEDGAIINALHFKAENPKGVILYFHGNMGDLSRWGKITEFFVELNYDVFVMDYRTYGKSTGTLNEEAFYTDAEMCYNYVLKHYNESEITIYGRSLGTGIATYLAANKTPKQLILETPYYSLADVAKRRFSIFYTDKTLRYNFPSHIFIQQVNCPISIFHGTKDNVIPYKSGKKLFDCVATKNKSFYTIEKGKHNNLIEFEAYYKQIKNILK